MYYIFMCIAKYWKESGQIFHNDNINCVKFYIGDWNNLEATFEKIAHKTYTTIFKIVKCVGT
jgi:hypothetical protein